MGKGRGFKLCGLDGIYFKSSYFTWLPCYLISLANRAIGSVQSMAVVINVMCIFKDVAGVEGQSYCCNTHTFVPDNSFSK